jgi:hypothetical protein
MRGGEAAGFLDLGPRDLAAGGDGDVLGHARPEQHRLLRDEGEGAAQAVLRDLAQVLTVDGDAPRLGVGEAQGKAQKRGLARP